MRNICIIIIALIVLVPKIGFAQSAPVRIAVLRGSFLIEQTGFDAAQQAETVRQHASDGVRLDAGYEVVDPKVVDGAALSVAGQLESGKPKLCLDDDCLNAVSRLTAATGAVQLDIVKKNDGAYTITVRSAIAPPETAEVDKGMAVVLEVARRLAGGASRRIAQTLREPEPPSKPEPDIAPEADAEQDTDTAESTIAPVEGQHHGLHKGWFFGSLGLTCAVGLTWGIVEGVTWSHIQDAKKDDQRTDADIDELRGLQVASRVLLISSAAFAVTTAVLAFVTDFDPEKKSDAALAPVITDTAVGIGLTARF